MHRSARRTVIALGALASFWFALASDAYGLHDCPHHDGVVEGTASGHVAAAPHNGAHDGAARAGVHSAAAPAPGGTATTPAGVGGHGDHGEGVCNCVGDCAGGGGSAPLPGSVAPPRVVETPTPPQSVSPRCVIVPLDPPDYLLPPATAPPHA